MNKYRNSKDGCKRALVDNVSICKNVDQCKFSIVEDYTYNYVFWAIVENVYRDIKAGYRVDTNIGDCVLCDLDSVRKEIERY